MLKTGGSFTMQNGGLTTKNHRFNGDMFRVQWDIYNQQIVSVWFVWKFENGLYLQDVKFNEKWWYIQWYTILNID